MKKMRNTTKPVLFCFVMALTCIVGTITAFACEVPHKPELNNFSQKTEQAVLALSGADNIRQNVNYFFTDKEGHITPLSDLPQRLPCDHVYVQGTTRDHARKNNGGCIVTVRSAKCCKYCGSIVEGGVISTTEYTVCPH